MDRRNTTRRRYLTGASTAAAALAGCLGGSGDDSMDGETTGADGMGDGDAGMDDGDDGMDDGATTDDPTEDGTMATTFELTVANVSSGDTLETMDGGVAVPLSPGVYAVHSEMAGLFTPGDTASDGLEALAEDGLPGGLADEVAGADEVYDSGAFATPTGADEPAPLMPGDSYEFSLEASADANPELSLATMFVQSNDLFYAPEHGGLGLFDDGDSIEGDVTDAFALWDAGTEENQPPGEGPDQAPRQDEAGAGPDEMGPVRRIADVDDGHDYPDVADVLRVTVTTM